MQIALLDTDEPPIEWLEITACGDSMRRFVHTVSGEVREEPFEKFPGDWEDANAPGEPEAPLHHLNPYPYSTIDD